ncbi:MAG: LTA synthase family protein [Candidatus Muirbacterium halophilum]|nr:LTA synthase family protein [Candidatus Muirbacterium halophilum]MCK9475202.1 LTA synthase family protein [Candidatus Muirbacterium halophilum]
MNKINNRYKIFIIFFLIFLGFSLLSRLTFFIYSFVNIDKSITQIFLIFIIGLFYDTVTASYFLIPLSLLLLILPEKILHFKYSKIFFWLCLLFYNGILIFNLVSEYLFWEEFEVRYNFIAVDYLVYTNEVIGNIKESYNLPLLLTLISVIATILSLFFYKFIKSSVKLNTNLKTRFYFSAMYLIFLVLFILFIDSSYIKISNNVYNNEVAKNGIYQIFHAFRHNTLDFNKYYMVINNPVFNLKKIKSAERIIYSSNNSNNITRKFQTNFPENNGKNVNIILITIESMSAEFMNNFGNKNNLTPNLDNLSKKGIFLTNLFATGTRTVRGMEAITLSIPPTPGRSIVKRPHNENLNSIGFVLKEKGYENKFIYSGHGYFDNMNYFYKNNGFDIVDRTDFKKNEISFANIWGVCDEDLYKKVLKEADKSYSHNKPFYFHVMTTSNHRPYTYPEPSIDIPSGTGRHGAVKYTDYAIGKLISEIKNKEWMKNTLLIISADHCASSAGKTTLNAKKYSIPLIIYSPHLIKPQKIEKICSQIDLAPTILDLIGIEYESKFFGESIFSDNFVERAFIGNYQSLGLLNSYGKLSIISPTKRHELFNVDINNYYDTTKDLIENSSLLNQNISFYQSADFLFTNKLYKYNGGKNESNI